MIAVEFTAIMAAIKAAILAISPTYAYRRAVPWTFAETPGVEELRRFHLDPDPAARVRDDGVKVWGIGEHYDFELRIVVGYGDVPADADYLRAALITRDAVDLDKAMHGLMGPTAGLILIDQLDPHADLERDERVVRRATYRYRVGYMQSTN